MDGYDLREGFFLEPLFERVLDCEEAIRDAWPRAEVLLVEAP